MNAYEFATAMGRAKPSLDVLLARGLPPEGVALVRKSFDFRERVGTERRWEDALLDLTERYDCPTCLPCDLRFEPPTEAGTCWLIGAQEGAELVIEKTTGVVSIRERGTAHMLDRCAADGALSGRVRTLDDAGCVT